MATVGVGQNSIALSSSLAEDMEATHNSVMGHLELSPKFVRHFLNIECKDKLPTETYKDYFKRLQGSAFHYEKWKKLCSFSWEVFDRDCNPDMMDITALGHLFYSLFKIKKDSRDNSKFMNKLQSLKNLRNEVMHSSAAARNPSTLSKLEGELVSFIQVAGNFYSLTPNEVQNLETELKDDVKAGFSVGKKRLMFACSCMVNEGWTSMEHFVRCNFTAENLMFGIGRVERSAVFHDLEVMLRDGKEGRIFSYVEIFENVEKCIIVSGVAGAGKSTLLENIALQFIKPQPDTSIHLKDFQLLVYVQCRDRASKTLCEVLKQQFSDVCNKFGEDFVLEAIYYLRVLFLIDGYDEYDQSMTILQEVVKMTWRANCRVIITTRPHAVKQLGQMLSGSNIFYLEFEIAPLVELDQQINFLAKYEPHLVPDEERGALRESFKTLDESMRSLFSEPLKLLQFCNVFVTFPERIYEWKKPSDLAKDTFNVYKTLIEKKVANVSYPDLNIVIDDLFFVISEAALDFIRSNSLTFTEDQFQQVQRRCRSKLRDDHDIKYFDTNVVLSSVLKMKRPLTGHGAPAYSFNHKTDEEYFASRCVVQKIMDGKLSVENILLGRIAPEMIDKDENVDVEIQQQTADISSFRNHLRQLRKSLKAALTKSSTQPLAPPLHERSKSARVEKSAPSSEHEPLCQEIKSAPRLHHFLEVLQYAVQSLNASDPALLEQRWPELRAALQDAGVVSHKDWQSCMLACPDVPLVAQHAAAATISVMKDWEIRTGHDVAVVALMLPHEQPRLLEVDTETHTLSGTRWLDIAQLRDGDMRLDLGQYMGNPCDALFTQNFNRKVRLVSFQGCVTTKYSVDAVAAASTPDADLQISLTGPLELSALGGKYKSLKVTTRPFLRGGGDCRAPLPALPPPKLRVWDAKRGTWPDVARTVITLAPFGNRYGTLRLWESQLCDEELDQLVVTLQCLGVRTADEGHTHWKKGFSEKEIYITEELPDNLARVRNVRDQIIVLDASHPEELGAEWPALKDALETAGASHLDWQHVMQKCPHLPDVARLAAEATMAKESEWLLRTGEDVAIAAQMLPHAQPQLLEVDMTPRELLKTVWEEVVRCRVGDLRLDLSGGACDDVLTPLQDSRCRLVYFKGQITSAASVSALSSVAADNAELLITLQGPLQLCCLQDKYDELQVTVQPFGDMSKDANAAPLPGTPLPELLVTDASPWSWDDVMRTVKILAPHGSRYRRLRLQRGRLSKAALDRLVVTLHRQGIRTDERGPTRWKRGGYGHLLRITDNIPDNLDRVSSVLDLRDCITELNNKDPGQLRADWPTLKDELQTEGATYVDWQDLMLSCPILVELPLLAAQTTLAVEQNWELRTRRDVAAAALMLLHGQPNVLEVNMKPDELRASSWPEAAQRFNGEMKLHFLKRDDRQDRFSLFGCDDLLSPLLNSKCQLTEFWGCISTDASVPSLASVTKVADDLRLWLSRPLQLGALQGKYKELTVYTRPFGEAVCNTAMPLPAQLPADLVVEFVPKGSWSTVAHTVKIFTPVGNKYGILELCYSELSCSEVDQLLVCLQKQGVRTESEGSTRSENTHYPSEMYSRLHITDELPPDLLKLH